MELLQQRWTIADRVRVRRYYPCIPTRPAAMPAKITSSIRVFTARPDSTQLAIVHVGNDSSLPIYTKQLRQSQAWSNVEKSSSAKSIDRLRCQIVLGLMSRA